MVNKKLLRPSLILSSVLLVSGIFTTYIQSSFAASSSFTPLKYVALGDSVASGHGLGTNFKNKNIARDDTSCQRSTGTSTATSAYTDDVSQFLKDQFTLDKSNYFKLACTGDTSTDVQTFQLPQVDSILGEDPSIITLSAGVNDFKFSDLKTYKTAFNPAKYKLVFVPFRDQAARQVHDNLLATLQSLGNKHPNRRIIVTTYYNPFNAGSVIYQIADKQGAHCETSLVVRPKCSQIIEDTLQFLNGAITTAVGDYNALSQNQTGFAPVSLAVDVEQAFRGHESPMPFCGSSQPAFNDTYIQAQPAGLLKVSPAPNHGNDCFHPNPAGHLVIAKLVEALIPAKQQVDWSNFGFDSRNTRFNSKESVLGVSNVSNLALSWTGSTTSNTASSSVVVANGIAYVNSTDNKLNAYSANGCGTAACTPLWTFTTDSPILSTPVVDNGIVYVTTTTGKLYAISASTHAEVWPHQTIGDTGGGCGYNTPLISAGVLYVATCFGTTSDPAFFALDAATGQIKWTFSVSDHPAPFHASSPTIDGNRVFIGSAYNKLVALDANTGNEVWFGITNGSIAFSNPTASNGVVYTGSFDNDLYAFDENCNTAGGPCAASWVGVTGAAITSSPAISNGHVYVTSTDGFLYSYATAGCVGQLCPEEWKFQSGGPISSSPASANGVIYFGSSDSLIYGLSESSHSLLWKYKTGGSIGLSSPTVVNSKLYILSEDQKLYSLGLP
jgi:outer membrane protein assembly factor BamB/lysophospholipase L1-like esterase